jgi:NAD(P)-dependent dehydrogenase (short-subunit alcohol dehydrogenase family)
MAKTILITGSNRGLGLELATQYAAAGWRVLACCRDPGRAEALRGLASEYGERVGIHPLDVTDNERIGALAGELNEEAIDILFNNAGVGGGDHQSLGRVDTSRWLEVFKVNCVAPLKVAEAFSEHVARSERRIIATMGTRMGSIADNTSGDHYIYRSTKAAVHMVAKGLSVDLREVGIISVVLHPGWVKTGIGGSRALLTPAESVAGLRRVLTSLTMEDSGKFLDYRGQELPW